MDFMKIMKQAGQLQSKMGALQAELAEVSAEGSAGAGLVKVTMNGTMALTGVTIDPSLMKPDEAEILEDLIVAAATDAKTKIEAAVQEKTQAMMGDMGLPAGFQLPFGG